MTQSGQYLLFLYDPSRALERELARATIRLSTGVEVVAADFVADCDLRGLLSAEAAHKLSKMAALRVHYENELYSKGSINSVQNVALALQLVKPIRHFQEYWINVTSESWIKSVSSAAVKLFATDLSDEPYLEYQQLHTLQLNDIEEANKLLPQLSKALKPGFDSWNHPYLSVHRAVLFFGQGYGVNLGHMRQFLWAAALDCLFCSKNNPSLRGAKAISRRMCQLLGRDFRPYEEINLPTNQAERRNLSLQQIGKQIFKLRNAYVHGLSISDKWLTDRHEPPESGYAYQLLECTEIVLREALKRILSNPELFETFADAEKLDDFFEI